MTNFGRSIYSNYSDSNFFRFFLFNWVSIENLMKLNKSTLFIIGYYLHKCCNIVKNHIDFFLFGKNENKKKDNLEGFNNFIDYRYYDFTKLKNGEFLVEDESLLSLTDKIFSLNNKMVKIKRINQNEVIVSDLKDLELIKYEFDSVKMVLNIIKGSW